LTVSEPPLPLTLKAQLQSVQVLTVLVDFMVHR
jgi:hypothetical protein